MGVDDVSQYCIATIQVDFPIIHHRDEILGRVAAMAKLIDDLIIGYRHLLPIKMVVFPEFAIAPVSHATTQDLIEHIAINITDPVFDPLFDKARNLDIYIQAGSFLEYNPKWPHLVFNTALLIGPRGIELSYRKVNPLIPLELCASPADLSDYREPLFPVADTSIGRIGLTICYDLFFPETFRQLASQGAEIILNPSAWMPPWGAIPPQDTLTVLARARAIENKAYIITSCLTSTYRNHPPFSWNGGSAIINPVGQVIAQAEAGSGDHVAIGLINLEEVRGRRLGENICNSLLHLRTHAYPVFQQAILKQNSKFDTKPITEEELLLMIQNSREQLNWSLV